VSPARSAAQVAAAPKITRQASPAAPSGSRLPPASRVGSPFLGGGRRMRAMTMVVVVVFCLAVGGCAPTAEQLAQQTWSQRQFDEDKCESYGSKKGDPAYVQCRAQLDAARTGAVAAIEAARSTPAPTVIVQPRR
jgi:hypothetical protein